MIKKFFKNIGPGTLVAAAFIGPGTVTLCTIAGVNFGFALLWAMILSIVATIILQEMAARLGVISQKGLSEVIRSEIKNPILKKVVVALILFAIVIGNAGLVLIMSISFFVTAILTKPSLSAIFKGAFVPEFPKDSLLTIVGLIGTTVVPYNLFLHASLVKEKWNTENDLSKARKDTFISIILGGIVSMAIIISASAIQSAEITNASDLAKGLEPLFGSFSKYFLAIGLFAAGITSAITAPLAAAYVAKGCFGWQGDLKSNNFRSIWVVILMLGVIISSLSVKSILIIKFAQVANGMLLPIIAGFLLWIMNKKSLLGEFKNTAFQNTIGFIILTITIFLGLKSIFKVLNII